MVEKGEPGPKPERLKLPHKKWEDAVRDALRPKQPVGAVIIDPPLGPYSPVREILDWIKRLRGLEAQAADPGHKEAFGRAINEALAWLDAREGEDG